MTQHLAQAATNLLDPDKIPAYIAAVGALGLAAFGVVEALGKTLFVFKFPKTRVMFGLPYVGFRRVQELLVLVGPALSTTYGDDYEKLIRQQYRSDRGKGQAPESIRQGVRLGLPFMDPAGASKVISAVWGLPQAQSDALAAALRATPADAAAAPASAQQAQVLAARFASALDSRVQAVFDLAEEVYETRAQFWAAIVAIVLSLGYEWVTVGQPKWSFDDLGRWAVPFLVGVVAVPLAPAAKDLSTALSSAMTALGQIRSLSK